MTALGLTIISVSILPGAYPGGVLRVLKHPPEAQTPNISEYCQIELNT